MWSFSPAGISAGTQKDRATVEKEQSFTPTRTSSKRQLSGKQDKLCQVLSTGTMQRFRIKSCRCRAGQKGASCDSKGSERAFVARRMRKGAHSMSTGRFVESSTGLESVGFDVSREMSSGIGLVPGLTWLEMQEAGSIFDRWLGTPHLPTTPLVETSVPMPTQAT